MNETAKTGQAKGAATSGRNRTVALACAAFVACMVGAAYAAVPLYDLFCKVTGYAGTTRTAEVAPATVRDEIVRVRFDANAMPGLDWSFRPAQPYVDVRIGEIVEVSYIAENHGTETSVGTATFNVTPQQTGAFFNKLACFCFTRQELAAGERVEMGVQFFVDPSILDDPETADIHTITLSYTFFAADRPSGPVALAPSAAPGRL